MNVLFIAQFGAERRTIMGGGGGENLPGTRPRASAAYQRFAPFSRVAA